MVQALASQNSEMAAHVVTHYATLQGIARGAQLRHGLPADMRVDLVQNLVLRLLELERASSVPELVPGSGPWLGWITTVCRIVALESRRALGQRTLSLTPDDVREQCANCEANLARSLRRRSTLSARSAPTRLRWRARRGPGLRTRR